jgi:hypothetical protein
LRHVSRAPGTFFIIINPLSNDYLHSIHIQDSNKNHNDDEQIKIKPGYHAAATSSSSSSNQKNRPSRAMEMMRREEGYKRKKEMSSPLQEMSVRLLGYK